MSEKQNETETTEQTETKKPRVFVYNGNEFKDPGPEYTVEDVKKHLTTMYPEIARCTINQTETDTEIRIEFVKRAGTKGKGHLDETEYPMAGCYCATCEGKRGRAATLGTTETNVFTHWYLQRHGRTPETIEFLQNHIRKYGETLPGPPAAPKILDVVPIDEDIAGTLVSGLHCPHCGGDLDGSAYVSPERPTKSTPCPLCGRRMIVSFLQITIYQATPASVT